MGAKRKKKTIGSGVLVTFLGPCFESTAEEENMHGYFMHGVATAYAANYSINLRFKQRV
jgi:purine nucleoside phosphorylase